MPIYIFKYKNCGEVFDFLALTKSEEPKCEKCGSKELEKQITAFSVNRSNSSYQTTSI